MQPHLTSTEAKASIDLLRHHLSPSDLQHLRALAAMLPADDSGITVADALSALYPDTAHSAATDKLGRLRKNLAAAATTVRHAFALETQGAKKAGSTGRRLWFVGEPRIPEPSSPALEMIEGREIQAMALPQDGTIAMLFTVNDNETRAVFDRFVGPGRTPVSAPRNHRPYNDLGRHGDFRVIHFTCAMGSGSRGAAQSRVTQALNDWRRVQVLIAVGIAFGARPDEQAEADVLVSSQLVPYELQRMNTDDTFVLRGDKVSASSLWLNRVRDSNIARERDSAAHWPRVHRGLLLTGEKLVDRLEFRGSLVEQTGGLAIGGEMEGAGLYTAATDHDDKPDWIVIKGISDWADGTKKGSNAEARDRAEALQRQAASNAACVVWSAITMLPIPPHCALIHPPASDPPRGQRHRLDIDLPSAAEGMDTLEPTYTSFEDVGPRLVNPRAAPTSLTKRLGTGDADDGRPDDAAAVEALEHILAWLNRAEAPALFALLGEYGMGKTVLCQRLAKHLNNIARDPEAAASSRRAYYFDLRHLVNLRGRVPTLDEVLVECIQRGYPSASGQPQLTPERVRENFAAGALVIFDGLDEVLVHYDAAPGQAFTRELLGLRRTHAKGRLLISCRTHFFRTWRDQVAHFTGEDRSPNTAAAYEAMTLLPFNEAQIRLYLERAMVGADPDIFLALIRSVHNLPDLAGRPYTLSLITEFLPQIQRDIDAGKVVYGVTLYGHMVRSWLERDTGKHHLKPDHKLRLAAHLAAELWRLGQRSIEPGLLETWFSRWLRADEDLAARYAQLSSDKLEEDLRNSTFLVRDDPAAAGEAGEAGEAGNRSADNAQHAGGFRFAHSSMQEFFIARYLFDAALNNQPSRWQMPVPSRETLAFLGQLFAEARGRKGTDALANLSSWRSAYRAQASELLLAYALHANQAGWPVPLLVDIDLRGAFLAGWHLAAADVDADAHADADARPKLDMTGASFSNAVLRECTFDAVRLTGASFDHADLRGAVLERCDLAQADFSAANCAGTTLRHCRLAAAVFDNCKAHGMQWLFCEDSPHLPAGAVAAPAPSAGALGTAVALPLAWLGGHIGGITACAWAPDGSLIASAGSDGTLRLWDPRSGQALRTLQGHQGEVLSCAFSADGTLLASAGQDGTLRLWDPRSGQALRTLQGHLGRVRSCAFSADVTMLASAGEDGRLHLWDPRSGLALRTLQGHQGGVWSCAFSADSTMLASAGRDGRLRLWDSRTGRVLRTLQGHQGGVLSCTFSADGTMLASAGEDATVRLWDPRSGQALRSLHGHQVGVWSCAFSTDGTMLASAGEYGGLGLWDPRSGQALRTLQGHHGRVLSCAFSTDGTMLASAGSDGRLRLWDPRSSQALRRVQSHQSLVSSCAFSTDGTMLASAGDHGSLRLWYSRSGQALLTLRGHQRRVLSCAFAADGTMLASAGENGTLRLWDPRSGQALRTLQGHQGWVWSCAFAADGTMLASAGSDATLRLWDPRSGQALRTLHGHQGTVRSCAFSADGTMLASAGDDGTLRLWDPRSGQALRTLQDHKGYVMSCAFSTDGTMLASTGEDGTLRLWAPRSGQALRVTAISPTGHATWSPTDGRVIEADGDAWRWLAWLTHDAEGRPTRLPLEYFGAVPQPQRLQHAGPPAP